MICQKNKLPQSLWIISMSLKTIVKVVYLFALWRRDWLERYYAWKVLPKDTISVFSELWISSTHKLVWCIKCHVTWEHECGGPQISEVTRLGGVKNDPPLLAITQPRHPGVHFLKIPPPPCKQLPKTIKSRMCLECMMDVSFIPVTNITNEYLKRQIEIWRKKIVFPGKKLNKQNYNQYLKYLKYWNFPIANFFASKYVLSLRTADAFPVVASLPP